MVSEAQRTLVKSRPELWAELSNPDSLARHLDEFGEIRITRSEPEKAVEWEGEAITGTVTLAPSGWGTRVTLTVTRELPEPEPEPVVASETAPEALAAPDPEPEPDLEPEPEPDPEPQAPPETESRRGFFARLFRRRHQELACEITEPEGTVEPEPQLEMNPEPQAEPQLPDISAELAAAEELVTDQTTAVLTAVLDRLGAAHHRPFSRS